MPDFEEVPNEDSLTSQDVAETAQDTPGSPPAAAQVNKERLLRESLEIFAEEDAEELAARGEQPLEQTTTQQVEEARIPKSRLDEVLAENRRLNERIGQLSPLEQAIREELQYEDPAKFIEAAKQVREENKRVKAEEEIAEAVKKHELMFGAEAAEIHKQTLLQLNAMKEAKASTERTAMVAGALVHEQRVRTEFESLKPNVPEKHHEVLLNGLKTVQPDQLPGAVKWWNEFLLDYKNEILANAAANGELNTKKPQPVGRGGITATAPIGRKPANEEDRSFTSLLSDGFRRRA